MPQPLHVSLSSFPRLDRTYWMVIIISIAVTPAFGAPGVKIIVDFKNATSNPGGANGWINDSDGSNKNIQTVDTALNAAQRTAIMDKIKLIYQPIFGPGNSIVQEGTITKANPAGGGDYGVVITNTRAPGREFGDAGADKKNSPSIVYYKEFTTSGFDVTKVANYVGETAAHEVGHRFGLAHTKKNPPNPGLPWLMSAGGELANTAAARKTIRENDGRSWRFAEIKVITANAPAAAGAGAKKDASKRSRDLTVIGGRPELNWIQGTSMAPREFEPFGPGTYDSDDDQIWAADVSYNCPISCSNLNLDVGYINVDGEFFMVGDRGNVSEDILGMAMIDQGESVWGAVMALRDPLSGEVFDYTSFGTDIVYSHINPYNSQTFLSAQIGFNILSGPSAGSYNVLLDATNEHTSGGFTTSIPEPGAGIVIVLISLMFSAWLGQRRQR